MQHPEPMREDLEELLEEWKHTSRVGGTLSRPVVALVWQDKDPNNLQEALEALLQFLQVGGEVIFQGNGKCRYQLVGDRGGKTTKAAIILDIPSTSNLTMCLVRLSWKGNYFVSLYRNSLTPEKKTDDTHTPRTGSDRETR